MKASEPKKEPKTEMDRRFLETVQQIMSEQHIASDRAMSQELGYHSNFLSRIKTGVQSAPPEAWGILISKYHIKTIVLIDEDRLSTNNYHKVSGNVIGTNHGTATQTYNTLADCEKELLSCQAQLAEAISKLTQSEQERTATARELEVMRELVKAKDEMILLLKGGYNRPN